jgi:hypothetical protein
VPAETGKFRNVVPKAIEDMLKEHQRQAWEARIEGSDKVEVELRPDQQPILTV